MYHIVMNEETYAGELDYDEPREIEPQGIRAILATPGGRLAWRLGFNSIEHGSDPWVTWKTPWRTGATFTHRDYCLERAEVVRDCAPQVSVLGGLYAGLGLLGTHRTPPPLLEPLLEGALRDGAEKGVRNSLKPLRKQRWIWPLGSDLFVDADRRIKVWIVPFEYKHPDDSWDDVSLPYIGVKPYSIELTRAIQLILIQQEIASRLPIGTWWKPSEHRLWGSCFSTPEEFISSGLAFTWQPPLNTSYRGGFERSAHLEGLTERRPTRPFTKILKIHELLDAMTQATGNDHD